MIQLLYNNQSFGCQIYLKQMHLDLEFRCSSPFALTRLSREKPVINGMENRINQRNHRPTSS